MQNEITLTQSEIEMIQVKREQEALKEREALLKKAAENEKQILVQKSQMRKNLEHSRAQVAATKDYLDEFMGGWKLQVDTQNVKYEVRNYLGDNKWESVWEEYQLQEVARIVNGQYTIRVAEHVTSGDKWGYGQKNRGFKMFLSGPGVDWAYEKKALGRVSTLIKKYDEVTEAIRYRAEQVQKQASAKDKTIAKMKELYPDATVEGGKGGEYANSWNRTGWVDYDTVTITFANGIKIKYRVYADMSLGRKEVTFPKMETAYDLMDVMNNVTFNK
jgi:hypothetical protein